MSLEYFPKQSPLLCILSPSNTLTFFYFSEIKSFLFIFMAKPSLADHHFQFVLYYCFRHHEKVQH